MAKHSTFERDFVSAVAFGRSALLNQQGSDRLTLTFFVSEQQTLYAFGDTVQSTVQDLYHCTKISEGGLLLGYCNTMSQVIIGSTLGQTLQDPPLTTVGQP